MKGLELIDEMIMLDGEIFEFIDLPDMEDIFSEEDEYISEIFSVSETVTELIRQVVV